MNHLDPGYVRFTAGPNIAQSDRIHVTLNQKGRLRLNANAFRLLGAPRSVVLFYDPNKKKIAVSPCHPQLADAFPVKIQAKDAGTRIIFAASLCRHFRIDLDTTERFIDPDIDSHGVLHLDLTRTVTVGGHKRRPKKDLRK